MSQHISAEIEAYINQCKLYRLYTRPIQEKNNKQWAGTDGTLGKSCIKLHKITEGIRVESIINLRDVVTFLNT